MKKTLMILLILGISGLPASSYALKLFGIGPRGGYYKVQDAETGKMYVGASARLKLAALGFEGAIDYRSEEYAGGNVKITSLPVSASVLLYPLPIVYGIAGFGWYNSTIEYSSSIPGMLSQQSETEQQIGYHFGGGVELPLSSAMSIAADIRYVYLDYQFDSTSNGQKVKSDFYAITLSMFWGF